MVPLVWMLPFTRILLVALGHLDVVGNIQIRENYDENADSCSLHQSSLHHSLHHAKAQSDRVQESQNASLSSHHIQYYRIPSKFAIVTICSSPAMRHSSISFRFFFLFFSFFEKNEKKKK
jgi:hypothetical protein